MRHISAAMLVGFLGSSIGNIVIMVAARDLLEIDLLISTSIVYTNIVTLSYTQILSLSAVFSFSAALIMCYLTTRTKSPGKYFFAIASTIFVLSCWWPFSLPITITLSAKITLFLMYLVGAAAITAPMLRARECALRSFLLGQLNKAPKANLVSYRDNH